MTETDTPSPQGAAARPGASSGTTPAPMAPRAPRSRFKRALTLLILLGVVVAGAVYGIRYWLNSMQYEETDDAYVEGNVVPVSSRVAGVVLEMKVHDNQDVAAGDVLATIDPRDIQADLAQAKAALEAAQAKAQLARTNVELMRANTAATLAQAQAGVEQADAAVHSAESALASAQADVTAAQADATRRQADLKRYKALDPRVVSQQQLDAARAAAEATDAQLNAARKRVAASEAQVIEARARVAHARGVVQAAQTADQQIAASEAQARSAAADVDQARAVVSRDELSLSYTTVKAPVDGRVTRKSAQGGQYLQVGQALLALVRPRVWVVANFKETQLTHIEQGQPAEIWVDAYPDKVLHGHVQSIQAGTGARFSLLPPENATGNYVKVVQRVPVKIDFDGDPEARRLLAPGMSVVCRVRIAAKNPQEPSPLEPDTRPASPGSTHE